jgi:hypothetical protein
MLPPLFLCTPFLGSSPTDFERNLIMGTNIPPAIVELRQGRGGAQYQVYAADKSSSGCGDSSVAKTARLYIVLRTPFSGSSPTDFDKNLIMGTKIPPERHK